MNKSQKSCISPPLSDEKCGKKIFSKLNFWTPYCHFFKQRVPFKLAGFPISEHGAEVDYRYSTPPTLDIQLSFAKI